MNQPNDLHSLLDEINSLTQPPEMPRRVELCREALKLVKREDNPEQWASLQNKLANSLCDNPLGSRADNFEQAIAHYKRALEVYTQEAAPHDWAMTQNNLANALRNRIRGERADNLEQAIAHYKRALEVYSQEAAPHDWAMTQNNLAAAYSERIRGERADNLEQAIKHLQQALEVYTQEAAPHHWATTQNNLANALQNRIRGERADNLECAIAHYELALEVYSQKAAPHQWARTQNNLANAYYERIRGERADNIEQAIFHARLALEVYTQKAAPHDWATTQNNLAAALRNRIRGERADNIEEAIAHYRLALEVYTQKAAPHQWAMTMHNLATAYSDRIRGPRADNIEQAIAHLKLALEVRTQKAAASRSSVRTHEWAGTQNNLAAAYYSRIRGVRADNIEQAIFHAKLALEVYSQKAAPHDWALTQNNLAAAYSDRIRGERADNIEQAIAHYKLALEVYSQKAAPHQWAMTQNNLAIAYKNRIRGVRADNIEQAIARYKLALEVYSQKAAPHDWAMTQNNLAIAYNSRIRGERADNIEEAIAHYKLALEVDTPHSFPQACRNTAYWLGHLLYNEKRFSEARKAFVVAHEAVEVLRGEMVREGSRRELADKNAYLYTHLVYCCLYEGDEEGAFEYAAAGKGRAFVDLLASSRFELAAVGADEAQFKHDWEKYREFRQQIDNLLVQLTGDQGMTRDMSRQGGASGSQEGERIPSENLYDQLRATQKEAAEHWEEMTFSYPALTACESAPTLSAQEARDLSAELGATLVEYYRHAEGWCAFVVTPDEVHYVALPDVTDDLLEEMSDWVEDIKYVSGRAEWTIEMMDEWYEAVMAPLNLPSIDIQKKMKRAGMPNWNRSKALDHRTPCVVTTVVLSPFGALSRLPLFAAREPESKRYMAQAYSLAFVPSLGALRVSHQVRIKRGQSALKRLLSVAYPGTPTLPNVIPEAEAVTKCFPLASSLHLDAATPKAVLEHAPDKQAIHLGCHGRFDAQHEQESGLMLAGGWLTIQRIIAELALKECQLVTLGACESWVLTQALMTAGASTVVSSQWVVNDSATRALFEAFYAHITNGYSPALAMRQATELIRSQPGWQHPYYWAPFNVNGLAHQAIPSDPLLQGCPLDGLSEQVETINRDSTRGEAPMNETRIKREAQIYLRGIARTHQKISLTDSRVIANQLAALSKQASTIQSESQLLALCDTIHKLAEETPVLRQLLIPAGTNVAQIQKDRNRFFDQKSFNKTSAQQQASPKALATLQQAVTKTGKKLEAHIKRLEALQARNEAAR